MIERIPKGLWTEDHNTVQEVVIKTIAEKKKCKKANGCLRKLRKEKEKTKEKRKDIPI